MNPYEDNKYNEIIIHFLKMPKKQKEEMREGYEGDFQIVQNDEIED